MKRCASKVRTRIQRPILKKTTIRRNHAGKNTSAVYSKVVAMIMAVLTRQNSKEPKASFHFSSFVSRICCSEIREALTALHLSQYIPFLPLPPLEPVADIENTPLVVDPRNHPTCSEFLSRTTLFVSLSKISTLTKRFSELLCHLKVIPSNKPTEEKNRRTENPHEPNLRENILCIGILEDERTQNKEAAHTYKSSNFQCFPCTRSIHDNLLNAGIIRHDQYLSK